MQSESISEEESNSATLDEGKFLVPKELREREQWIAFRRMEVDGKSKKEPLAPLFHYESDELFNVDPTSTHLATTFTEAMDFVDESRERFDEEGADGVGFVFTDDGPYVGVDLDDCRDAETGEIDKWARDVVEVLDSFTEVSPSGTGLHVLVEGELDAEFQNRNDAVGIEIYGEDRFFTVTGRWLRGTPETPRERPEEILAVQQEHLERKTEAESDEHLAGGEGELASVEFESDEADFGFTEERLVEKACACDDDFERLWEGEIAEYDDDHSRADFALTSKLAFWTKGRPEMMDSIFRESGLMRQKWDEQRGSQTYGELTIRRALASNEERFSGTYTA